VGITEIFADYDGGRVSFGIGLLVGLLFGAFAQQSRFCLRAACIECWRGHPGPKLAVWLLAFGAAMLATQLAVETGGIDTARIRQLNNMGSLSGAIVGGLLFGSGMILTRGCAGRLLVLSATGNIRALVAGLLVTIVAQASLRGGLAPLREMISGWWTVEAHRRSLAPYLPAHGGLVLGAAVLALGALQARRHRVGSWLSVTASLTGLVIALGWLLTSQHAMHSFDIVRVQSISFTGPAADTLMGLINEPRLDFSFPIGLVPGVFAGSLVASLLTREFQWQQFTETTGTARYLVGAVMMGFGAMLAGGCAIGAGVSGGAALVSTAWAALVCMWLGAGATDYLVDRPAA
jgi:uncharacterized membrane protein YedE/YeeE